VSDPRTYEEALTQGFKPAPDIEQRLATEGISPEEFNIRKEEYAARLGVDCVTAPPGAKCFDWTDDRGVRTICFCTPARACGNCVQK
jgi:hypothetical protein